MIKKKKDSPTEYTDPLLAFSWGHHLTILKVTAVPLSAAELSKKRRRPEHDVRLEFTRVGDWKSRNGIVALQWLSSQVTLIII